MWDGTRVLLPPTFSWGNRVSNTNYAPPNIGFPSQNVASSHRHLGEPDEGLGPAHDQDRLLHTIQQQAAGAGRRAPADRR